MKDDKGYVEDEVDIEVFDDVEDDVESTDDEQDENVVGWSHCCNLALKSDSHLPKNFYFICFIESPLEMKNAFFFILKALFVLKIFKFLIGLFGQVEKTA